MTGRSSGSPQLQLGADAETIHAYAGRQQTVSEHQQRIGEYLRLGAFDAAAPDFPFDPDLLRHVSPIEWKNVIFYGEIKIDPSSSALSVYFNTNLVSTLTVANGRERQRAAGR